MRISAKLDKEFFPIIKELEAFSKTAKKPISLMIEDAEGYNFALDFCVSEDFDKSFFLVERLAKSLIWIVGGAKLYVCGDDAIAKKLSLTYSKTGERAFDALFMEKVYKMPFEVISCNALPSLKRKNIKAGGHTDGCRIGFDAGGSDRKVSAVIDGEVVFSEEVVWHPKLNSDPNYHYEGITSALKAAKEKMPRVDAVGVSSAGIYINNKTCAASLFLKVPLSQADRVSDIYIDAVKDVCGDVPLEVANDGDVTAIAGAISLNSNNILGIAMGTSEAGGYVNSNGGLNGWLTELAFAPCDLNSNGAVDEWSGDKGCGVKYFSQDAVIKLAPNAGIELDESLSPAEKLKFVQGLMESGSERAKNIYETIGVYLGHTIPFYAMFYDIKYVLVLGRVLSGSGGDLIVEIAKKVLRDEYPHLKIKITTPDEKFKRVGQSIAAASLTKIQNQ